MAQRAKRAHPRDGRVRTDADPTTTASAKPDLDGEEQAAQEAQRQVEDEEPYQHTMDYIFKNIGFTK